MKRESRGEQLYGEEKLNHQQRKFNNMLKRILKPGKFVESREEKIKRVKRSEKLQEMVTV